MGLFSLCISKKFPTFSDDEIENGIKKVFLRFHEIVQADTYRVATRQEVEEGKGRAYHLNKDANKKYPGYKIDAMDWQQIEHLSRSNIEHLYVTPLSRTHHIILIDDATPAKLAEARRIGVVFAYVQQSSEESWQALIKIPRITVSDAPHLEAATKTKEYRASVEFAQVINDEFGDPGIVNSIQLHRMPGTQNVKKTRKINGIAPIVEIVGGEGEDWIGGQIVIQSIMEKQADAAETKLIEAAERAAARAARAAINARSPGGAGPEPTSAAWSIEPGGGDALYEIFKTDIEKNVLRRTATDISALDFMIAIRLRVIGIDQTEIADIILNSTPRGVRRHDWIDYTDRTASAAFGPSGDRQIEQTRPYHAGWIKLAVAGAEQQQRRPRPR